MTHLKILSVLLLSILSVGVNAKDPASSLIIKSAGDETLIFVKQSKMLKVKGSGTRTDMLLDVTYTSSNDSIAIKSTHLTDTPIQLDSVTIETGTLTRRHPLEKIYIEPDGRKWESRLCFNISRSDLLEMISSETPPKFIYGTEPSLTYQDNHKSWEKRISVFKLMLDIIEYNNE